MLSPSFAAPAVAAAVHEQALERLQTVTGLIPVEFPTARKLDASARDRAQDLNAAFADPEIRGVLATIGGEDQITVIGHLDAGLIANDPKPFLGYSDNTNLLNWLWTNGVAGYYGGSTQVQLGPGPRIDRSTNFRYEPPSSRANAWSSPIQASRRTSSTTGTIRVL